MDTSLHSIRQLLSTDQLIATSLAFGWKLLNAVIVMIVGLLIMRLLMSLLRTTLRRTVQDVTVRNYAQNATRVVLWVLLLLVIMSVFGIETTALAALLGAAGLAIGLALQGSLSNFASGFMLLLFRPFRTGDVVEVAGVTGKVVEIGIFSTTIDTPENVRAFVPNSAIFTGVIRNRTANNYLRVELKVTVESAADVSLVQQVIRRVVESHELVLETPRPDLQIVEDPTAGITLSVRPFASVENVEHLRTMLGPAIRSALREAGVGIVK